MRDALRKNIEIYKQKYYFKLSRTLVVNKINSKCYWSILKSFKKIPCIPPLIHNNQFVVDFNTFSTNVTLMDKPGSWFLLANCLKNTYGRVTF